MLRAPRRFYCKRWELIACLPPCYPAAAEWTQPGRQVHAAEAGRLEGLAVVRCSVGRLHGKLGTTRPAAEPLPIPRACVPVQVGHALSATARLGTADP